MNHFKVKPELKDFTKIPFFLFSIVGVTLFKYNSVERKTVVGRVIATVLITNAVINISLEIAYPCLETLPNTIDTVTCVCYLGYSINCVLKLSAVFRGRHLLHEVMEDMEMIYPSTKQDVIAYSLQKYYAQIGPCTRIIAVCHFVMTTMFNLFPFCQSIFEYISYGGFFVKRLPFFIYYPFDVTQFAVYFVAYLLQITCAWTMFLCFAGPDLLLVTIIHIICMHLRYLSNKIETFEPTGMDQDIEELNHFIWYHRKVLSLSYKINKVFSVSILVNYLASGGVICLTAFLVVNGIQILDFLKFISLMVISLAYVYLVCKFGTKLMEVSTDVSQEVFSHKWYLANMRYRKMLPLLISRAQKPAFLSAFKFFVVSMESFKTLISCSYQVFTLLRSSYQEV